MAVWLMVPLSISPAIQFDDDDDDDDEHYYHYYHYYILADFSFEFSASEWLIWRPRHLLSASVTRFDTARCQRPKGNILPLLVALRVD